MDYKSLGCWIATVLLVLVAAAVSFVVVRCVPHNCEDYSVADWAWILLQFGAAGAVGGCLAVLRLFDLETMYKSDDWTWTRARVLNLVIALAISAMGGIG